MTTEQLQNEVFDLMEINGVEVLFTSVRINRDIIPDNVFAYDIRANDNGTNDFATIEPFVRVNHTGTILSKPPLMSNEEYVEIGDYGFFDECTLTQYMTSKMEIESVSLMGKNYRLFHLNINGNPVCVAEEKLENLIQDCIEKDLYHLVQYVDERYGYYVSQDIADTENEESIKKSVIDIIDED